MLETNGTSSTILYPGLNNKERTLMLFIEDRANWRPPTHRDCAVALDLKDTKSVRQYINQIKNKGYQTVFDTPAESRH